MLFADTVYFLALLNPADQYHRKAVAVNQTASEDLITTQFILTEVGDALRHPAHRARFIELLALLQSQADVEIVAASAELFGRGCSLYADRRDKEWSLTDCTSFVVMRDRKINDALTSDHHFQQAGFNVLLV